MFTGSKLGNEATRDRQWHGKLFSVAIYDRMLDKEEIAQDCFVRWLSESASEEGTQRVSDGLVAGYSFEERRGQKACFPD